MHYVTFGLMAIGGLNWLLVGLLGWDVGMLFGGQGAVVSRVVYVLVGLATLWEIFGHKKCCKACGMGGSGSTPMAAQ